MIALCHAGYALPSVCDSVSSWCALHQQPSSLASDLQRHGANNYYRVRDESLLDLGCAAIERTLDESRTVRERVDALVVYQTSPCNVLPMPYSLAGALRKATRLSSALAFSVTQQQCVSPIHGLRVVDGLFRKHSHWRYAMLVGVDTILRENLRPIGISGFHSDASSALLVGRSGKSAITSIETYNDSKAIQGILADGRYEPNNNYLWSLISVIRRILKTARIKADQLTSVVPHNVNLPAWMQAMDALQIARSRLFTDNFARVGHAFGNDIAINIADSGILEDTGNHLVFASGIGGCFGGFLMQNNGACA